MSTYGPGSTNAAVSDEFDRTTLREKSETDIHLTPENMRKAIDLDFDLKVAAFLIFF
jgi:hypothetical protein